MNGLERKFGSRITFVRLNIHNPDTFALQDQLGFTTTPEFYLLDKSGAILGLWDEGISAKEMEQVFIGLLGGN